MIPLCTTKEIRDIDHQSIHRYKIPGIILMENAGLSVINYIQKELKHNPNHKIIIIAGKGNNAGDGFVIARHLHIRNYKVKVFCLYDEEIYEGDALINYQILKNMGLEPSLFKPNKKHSHVLNHCHLIIDALLGTGLSGPPREEFSSAIEMINQSPANVLSVDIPSGLSSDNAQPIGNYIQADHTIMFGLNKVSSLFEPAKSAYGKSSAVEIGYIQDLYKNVRYHQYAFNHKTISNYVRPNDTYKNKCGKLLILAGSHGYTGAAILSATAAMRTGCAMVILAIPQSLNPILESQLTEVMTLSLPEINKGEIDLVKSKEILKNKFDWSDALLIGPGLGKNPSIEALTQYCLDEYNKDIILDADGINHLASYLDKIEETKTSLTLTPHQGEFKNLFKCDIPENGVDQLELIRELSLKYKINLQLKGAPSISCSKEGELIINSSGAPCLATSGSGDVLAGIIAAFISRNMESFEALTLATFIHGLCGEKLTQDIGVEGVVASDIVSILPKIINSLIAKEE